MFFDVSPSQFFVQVEDAELSPRLPQGTLAVADRAIEPNVNDLVVVSDDVARKHSIMHYHHWRAQESSGRRLSILGVIIRKYAAIGMRESAVVVWCLLILDW